MMNRRIRRSLAGNVVVITGAAGGIGRALAQSFGNARARLALLDIDADGLGEAREAAASAGFDVVSEPCDVTDFAACSAAIEKISEKWGGVDILVNNAGISHRSLLVETDIDVIRRVVEVNLFGSVHCTKAALDSIIDRRGAIVAISSVAGFAPLIGRTGYAASKHALHGFFDTLRCEVAPHGVQVLLVCPAFIDTAMAERALSGKGTPVETTRVVANKPAPPELVGRIIIDGLQRGLDCVVPTPVAKAAYWLSRLSPKLYQRMMVRKQAAEFDQA